MGSHLILNSIGSSKTTEPQGAAIPLATEHNGGGMISRILNSPKSPVRRLTPSEYVDKLKEKQLVLDAEISLIDEEIEYLRRKLEDENSE
ncbi:hypothetical protein ABW20_dc0104151 [Dactylellina cionopaga]|nr:hypothetical protein ABW20_dc0104151 [Dactylellina cionopaga]